MESLGAVDRGCGKRVAGGIYAECPVGPGGVPFDHFLIDPPVPIDPSELGLTPIGTILIERDGVHHVMDWIGVESYPNVADFIEEGRRFGISRRLGGSTEFELLSEESRLITVHNRAWIDPTKGITDLIYEESRGEICPREKEEHRPGEIAQDPCIGMCWWDVQGGDLVSQEDLHSNAPKVNRSMPWGNYQGREIQGPVEYQTAIFGSFPLGRIAVIRDPEGGSHEEALDKVMPVRRNGLPVVVEDE